MTIPEVLSYAIREAWYLLTGFGGSDWADRRDAPGPARAGALSSGSDAEKLEKAFESNDYKGLVELLRSEAKIEAFKERMHPWADDPKTVGALSATHLAIQASLAEAGSPSVKEEIFKAGAIPPLVGFLSSGETDRVHAAVVALRFLTAECSSSTTAAYEAGAVRLLLQQIGSPPRGKRAAAATALRNICLEKDEYRAEFVGLGGLDGLVQQLDASEECDPALQDVDMQLEAILNLQDLLEDLDGNAIDSYVRKARDAGAVKPLQQLALSENDEVTTSAKEVLALLGA
ncbi:unnamed protein product [Prorocentrum cordatum]|uniref:Protein HGH1 homolog n=1 Tax=Prorocentrum cordatum TaxID=2364126 RepID=A0ABN9VJ94_9DINO|nr:unnamed protein product [Polarella glacialis]